jgi:hypothetical protein
LQEGGLDPKVWPLPAILFLMESAARVLMAEKSLGISTGHAETIAFVQHHLEALDGAAKAKVKMSKGKTKA